MSEYIIRTSHLTKYYGKHKGIEDLNLNIFAGEVYGFLGPNGAGKSTTIRLLLNLLRPTSGKVFILDSWVEKNYTRIFKNLGNLPGELKLYEELNGYGFLNYMASYFSDNPLLRQELIESFALRETDLNKKIKYYSHGMKQKLGIIQAMEKKPDLLIMDEPSEGLDPLNKNVLYQYINRFKNQGKTVFISSHYLAEVEKICDRVGLVRDGNLIAEQPISELKKKMVRRMELIFSQPFDIKDLSGPGIEVVEHENRRVVLKISGDINTIISKIARYKIENLIFPEPSLEDTFLALYKR